MLGQIDIGLNISSLGYLINTSICNKSMSQFIFCYTIYLLKIKIQSCQFLNLIIFTNLFPPYSGGNKGPPFNFYGAVFFPHREINSDLINILQ